MKTTSAIDPGVGYRLLSGGEKIQPGDEVAGESKWYQNPPLVGGHVVNAVIRRRIDGGEPASVTGPRDPVIRHKYVPVRCTACGWEDGLRADLVAAGDLSMYCDSCSDVRPVVVKSPARQKGKRGGRAKKEMK